MSETFDVFISYRSCDLGIAQDLHDRMRREGFSVWFDQARLGEDSQRLMPGCKWYTEIEEGCEKSRVILPVLTPDWKTSEWTRFETYGHDAIIPLLFRGEWEEVVTPPLAARWRASSPRRGVGLSDRRGGPVRPCKRPHLVGHSVAGGNRHV